MIKQQGTLCVIELGGTISCTTNSPPEEFYPATHSSLKNLIAKINIDKRLKIDSYPLFELISHEISRDQLIELAKFIQCLLDRNHYTGIVITMGTNALEDVAFFVSLVIQTETPIVFTGAHYPQNALSFDGERNLYNAFLIAASTRAIGLGVLITFGDCVVSARDAVNSPAGLPNNFSASRSPVGFVVGGEFFLRSKPMLKTLTLPNFHIDKLNPAINIAVIYAHLGMDERIVQSIIASGVDGIVSAGFGKGYQSKGITHCLKRAVEKGIVVVRCARSDEGYSGEDLNYDAANGFIKSCGLPVNKVAILLFIALSFIKDQSQLKEIVTG